MLFWATHLSAGGGAEEAAFVARVTLRSRIPDTQHHTALKGKIYKAGHDIWEIIKSLTYGTETWAMKYPARLRSTKYQLYVNFV